MALVDALMPEFDHEMSVTRKLLERVPEERFGWKPHEKSYTLGQLAQHVATLPMWGSITVNQSELDLGGVLLGHHVDEVVRHRRHRAVIHADPNRNAAFFRFGDDLAHILGFADVARIEPEPMDTGVERLERQGVLEVDVGNQRHR